MIFRPELAEKVLAGEKTVTRRRTSRNPNSPWWVRRCSFEVGREYSVQPGRGKVGVGRLKVVNVRLEVLGNALLGDEPVREGFDCAADFAKAWVAINGDLRFDELVWRVEFERVGAQ